MVSKRKRSARVAAMRKQLTYGPIQKRTSFNSGAVGVYSFNQVSYTPIEYFNLSADLNDLMDTFMPYYVRETLVEGAPNTYGALELAQRDMSNAALANRGAKLKYCGGICKYTFRNNWDVLGTISLTLLRANSHHDKTPTNILGHEVDEQHRSDVDQNLMLCTGLSSVKSSMDKYYDQVGKTQTITLQPGEQFEYSFKLAKGTYDDSIYGGNDTHYAGISMVLVARMIGGISHDSTTKTLVGHGKVQFDWVRRKYDSWRHVVDSPMSTMYRELDTDIITAAHMAVDAHEHEDGDGN